MFPIGCLFFTVRFLGEKCFFIIEVGRYLEHPEIKKRKKIVKKSKKNKIIDKKKKS